MLVAELMVRRTWLTLTRIITQAGCSSSLPYCTICVMDHPQNMIIDGARQHLGKIVTSLRSCQLGQLSSSTCFSELTQSSGATWDPKLEKQPIGIHHLSLSSLAQDHHPGSFTNYHWPHLHSLVEVDDDLGGVAAKENHNNRHQQSSHGPIPGNIRKYSTGPWIYF